jgi:hypothetical protein
MPLSDPSSASHSKRIPIPPLVSSSSLAIGALAASGFVVEWTTHFLQTKTELEAHYLCAFLNSSHLDQAVKPYQPKGVWGERHISRTPFEVVPIPQFNSEDERHVKLAKLSQDCHGKVAKLSPKGKSSGFLRSKVREHLKPELAEIDKLVKDIYCFQKPMGEDATVTPLFTDPVTPVWQPCVHPYRYEETGMLGRFYSEWWMEKH